MKTLVSLVLIVASTSIVRAEWRDSSGNLHMGSRPAPKPAQPTGDGFPGSKVETEKKPFDESQNTGVLTNGKRTFDKAVVLQVVKQGLIIENVYFDSRINQATSTVQLLIKNYPNEKNVADGDVLPPFAARDAGLTKLKRLSGKISTMRVYDCSDNKEEAKSENTSSPEQVATKPAISIKLVDILQASYGSEDQSADVTSILASKNQSVPLRIGNDTLGSDPAPGKTKFLNLKYSKNGTEKIVSVKEGESIDFSSL